MAGSNHISITNEKGLAVGSMRGNGSPTPPLKRTTPLYSVQYSYMDQQYKQHERQSITYLYLPSVLMDTPRTFKVNWY